MQSTLNKYASILLGVFLTVAGMLLFVALLVLLLRFAMGLLDQVPYFSLVFMLFTILVPFTVFTFAYIIFWKRTARHPNKSTRLFSYIIFAIAVAAWLYFVGTDLYRFFTYGFDSIGKYISFNMWVLAGSVAGLYLVGMIQALSQPKQADWLDKYNDIPQ